MSFVFVWITQWGRVTRQCTCGQVVALLDCSTVHYLFTAIITRGMVKDYVMTTPFEWIVTQVRKNITQAAYFLVRTKPLFFNRLLLLLATKG
jgi:hypothetical protein